jgi:phage-related protein
VADFIYKGRKASEFGLITKSKQRPIMPEIRQRYVEIMGRDGSYDYSSNELEDRVIEVTCTFYTETVGELRYKLREISAWLYAPPIESGIQDWENKLGTSGWLIFDDEPDIKFNAKVANKIDFDQTVTFGEFSIYFRCEPFGYSIEKANSSYDGYNLNLIYYKDRNPLSPTFNELILDAQSSTKYNTILYRELYPEDQFYYDDITSGSTYEFNNFGTMPVSPIIKLINFKGDDITITCQGKSFTLDLSSFKSNSRNFTIDCENYLAYISDVSPTINILDKMNGDFIKLNPRKNNVDLEGNWTQGDLVIDFNAKFL